MNASLLDRAARQEARDVLDDHNLSGRAREEAERALVESERFQLLARSSSDVGELYSGRAEEVRDRDRWPGDDSLAQSLDEANAALDRGLSELGHELVKDAVRVEVGGHSVDLTFATSLPCPVCNDEDRTVVDPETGEEVDVVTREAFYLGSADDRVGWVCGSCRSELATPPERPDDGLEPEEIVVVEEESA
mgnify:CR=1 FL=1